jgi:hypothetical protein
MKTATEIARGLMQCTGTEGYHFNWMFGKNFVYTDGVEYLVKAADAYWLLQAIFSYKRVEEFQLWKLQVMIDNTAILTMVEDEGSPNLVNQKIDYTDFPLASIEFYAINDHCREDGTEGNRVVLMLKSEY